MQTHQVNEPNKLENSLLLASEDTTLIITLDFDGCIFHLKYIFSFDPDRLIKENDAFLNELAQEIKDKKYKKVIFIIGSQRQSFEFDYKNNILKVVGTPYKPLGSCFPAIHILCAELSKRSGVHCEVYPILLTDIIGNHEIGYAFNQAIEFYKKNITPDISHPNCLTDESKFLIMYLQGHAIASHPDFQNMKLILRLYDDKYSKHIEKNDILYRLYHFVKDNNRFLSDNLLFQLYHYAGSKIRKIGEVQGVGPIDYNFRQNVINLLNHRGHSNHDWLRNINLIKGFGNTENFLANRILECKEQKYYQLQQNKTDCNNQTTLSNHAIPILNDKIVRPIPVPKIPSSPLNKHASNQHALFNLAQRKSDEAMADSFFGQACHTAQRILRRKVR